MLTMLPLKYSLPRCRLQAWIKPMITCRTCSSTSSKHILIFDTETTGFKKPRLVQLAWRIYDRSGTLISKDCYLVKPQRFKIPARATAIHGFSTEDAIADGITIRKVLKVLEPELDRVGIIV
jgi:DNA polymerase III epsilon subunit-like protein